MRRRFLAPLVLASLLCPLVAIGGQGEMLPKPYELLANPIHPDQCPITIVEWRPTSNKTHLTSPNAKAKKAISVICRAVLDAFPKFLEQEGIPFTPKNNIHSSFSLMPWEVYNEGLSPRNLNDVHDRFRDRIKFYNSAGQLLSLRGYTDRNTDYVYMRNDIFLPDNTISKPFMNTFAHELFHTLSDQHRVFDTLGPNHNARNNKDEQLAQKFTKFMGLGG